MVSFQAPTAINGTWEETARDLLASDLTSSFTARALEIGRQHHGVASEEARVHTAAMNAMHTAPPGFTGNLDIERLYPAADIQPSPTHPFGGYTTETMYRYAIAVIDAAMRCYLELSAWVTPRFDRTLGVRGLMPAEFGTMFYSRTVSTVPTTSSVRTNPDSHGFSGHLDPPSATSTQTTTGSP